MNHCLGVGRRRVHRRIGPGCRIGDDFRLGQVVHGQQLRRAGQHQLVDVHLAAATIEGLQADEVDRAAAVDAHHHALGVALFQRDQVASLAVQQLEGDVGADRQLHVCHFGHGQDRGQAPHDVEQDRLGRQHGARAPARGAVHVDRPLQGRPHPLARHLQDPEGADARRSGAGAVTLEVLAEAGLDRAAVLAVRHVDQVVDDHAAEVAQAQLAAYLVDALLVGAERRGLGVAVLAHPAAVDVDGHDGLRGLDHQRPARGEVHRAPVDVVDLVLDAEALEQRDGIAVHHHLGTGTGIGDVQVVASPLGRGGIIHDDALDGRGEDVTDRAHHQVRLGIQHARVRDGLAALLDGRPQPLQIGQVPLQLRLGLPDAGGPDDEAETIGRVQLFEQAAGVAAQVLVLEATRHPQPLHVGHHHEEAPGDGQVAGERGALGADPLLEDLDQHLLAATQAALDGRSVAARRLVPDPLALLAELAVEVLGMQVRDVEEAVALESEVDECRLDGGLHVDDAALVDVAHVGLGAGSLLVDLLQAAILDDRDAALLSRLAVDQHFALGHCRCRVRAAQQRRLGQKSISSSSMASGSTRRVSSRR